MYCIWSLPLHISKSDNMMLSSVSRPFSRHSGNLLALGSRPPSPGASGQLEPGGTESHRHGEFFALFYCTCNSCSEGSDVSFCSHERVPHPRPPKGSKRGLLSHPPSSHVPQQVQINLHLAANTTDKLWYMYES